MAESDDETTLAVGDTCMVTKAGIWRYDGVVHQVHNGGGLYDVYLTEEKITLTNKAQGSEVKKAKLSSTAQLDFEEENLRAQFADCQSARTVRAHQSRATCAVLAISWLSFAVFGTSLILTGFSLKPTPGAHPSGMCELCVYQRYRGTVCHLWPDDSPRCHEDFLKYIYGGAAAATIAVMLAVVQLYAGMSEFVAIACQGKVMGEVGGMTFHECLWPVCNALGWSHKAWWCCGDEATEREMHLYDGTVEALSRSRGRRILRNIDASLDVHARGSML
jgi:hypothetical protein